jgi:hypothetical protein
MISKIQQANTIVERLRPLKALEMSKAAPEYREAILEAVRQLCEIFGSANSVERAEIVSCVRVNFSFVFFSFARTMAEKAVQESAPNAIWDGLIAIVVENFGRDFRDSLVEVMLLYHSARKLGLDVKALFSKAASLAVNPDVALYLRRFPRREPRNRSLPAFFFEESGEGKSFAYKKVGPKRKPAQFVQ